MEKWKTSFKTICKGRKGLKRKKKNISEISFPDKCLLPLWQKKQSIPNSSPSFSFALLPQ